MKNKKYFNLIVVGFAVVTLLTGCGSSKTTVTTSPATKVEKIKVAYDQTSKPISWLDEKGNATGYDVETMKLVDALLPQYEFEYVGTTSDDLLVGVEQGKYQVGIKNAFWTKERTAKFIFPKEFIGLSSTGLLLKKKNEKVKTLSGFAKAGFTLAPIAANNAQYTIIDEYNKSNPNNKVKLLAGDSFTVDVVQWVNEGRVDGGVIIEGMFDKQVTAKDGQYHKFASNVVYNEFAVIKTWPLFNKKQQKFADAYDGAIKKLKEKKKTNELSTKFYGKDLFEVLAKVSR
ncbi:transporter substrate-binding domain-containing protein [Clostridium estertheticum]|uniref:transporter substrate-binding domain-containing protein n=1 Tax=Clostridium estertheticum TaxID=238834 RepID=UPI001C0CBCD3|nr:transporter substrate-binding domain-containing protein [Clostridium estertheticum]MBU3185863.1 transporter substrate-binding domain-containing protein [Clostridium estertheticum]